jgi:hypothetical protein
MRGLIPVALLLVAAVVLGVLVFATRWLCLKWLRPTATKGLTKDAIETLRRKGHINLEEFARLRRLVLGLDGPAEE